MGGREKPTSIQATSAEKSRFPFEAIHEVNERCLELLSQVARSDAHAVMLRPVGGDDKPLDFGGETRATEAPPGADGDTGLRGPPIAARRSRSG
ncbi:MAG: hypothetical protein ACREV7_16320, partial [Steroidobacteraceae bacterium]